MSTTLDTLQALDVPALTVAALTLTVVGLVAIDPVLGRRDHRALLADVAADAADGEGPRIRFYRRWTRWSWAWAAAVVVLVSALPGVGLDALGLRTPDLAGLSGPTSAGSTSTGSTSTGDALATAAGLLVGAVAAMLVGVVLVRVLGRAARRSGATRANRATGTDAGGALPLAGAAALTPMLPTTARGRRGWAALSVAAGVTEEVTYRGLVVLTLALLLPGADPRVVVAVAAVLFGLAHAYQGWTGVLATGLVGAALTGLYLATGSLLVPMVLHVLLDLRVLLLAPRTPRARPDDVARAAGPVPA